MKYQLLFLLLLCYLNSFGGIFRHDRPEKAYADLANQKKYDCVGEVFITDRQGRLKGRGSCVLIDKKYILSAAHVFYDGKQLNPNDFLFSFDGKTYKTETIVLHPQYKSGSPDYDLAVIKLSEVVESIVPAVLNTDANEFGAKVVGVGFGGVCAANQTNVRPGYKLAGENTIDSIGGRKIDGQYGLMMADFDCPLILDSASSCNKMGSNVPLNLEYTTTGGDSGGGLFKEAQSDKAVLIGICHGGGVLLSQFIKTQYYGQVMEWTRVSVFISWINEMMGKLQ